MSSQLVLEELLISDSHFLSLQFPIWFLSRNPQKLLWWKRMILFLLSYILALNHTLSLFFTGYPDFFQTFFCLLMRGLGVWPLVWAFIIFSYECMFPFLLPSLLYKICHHLFGSPCFSDSGCGCYLPESQIVFHSVSQSVLCLTLILTVLPLVGWSGRSRLFH